MNMWQVPATYQESGDFMKVSTGVVGGSGNELMSLFRERLGEMMHDDLPWKSNHHFL